MVSGGNPVGRQALRAQAPAILVLRELVERFGDSALLVLVFVAAWQAIYWVAGEIAVTSPVSTVAAAFDLLVSPDFWPNAYTTLRAVAIALVVEVVVGLPLGALCGLNRLLGEVVEPVLTGFYAIPKIVLYPIVLMFCGIGLTSVVVFAVMHGILPIMIFTMNAVRNIKPVYRKAARTMRLGTAATIRRIALPASIPEIFTGLRLGFGSTMVGVLLSEMFGSKSGLGFMLMNAIGLNMTDLVMSLTLLLAGFAIIVNLTLLAIDKRLHRRF